VVGRGRELAGRSDAHGCQSIQIGAGTSSQDGGEPEAGRGVGLRWSWASDGEEGEAGVRPPPADGEEGGAGVGPSTGKKVGRELGGSLWVGKETGEACESSVTRG
jgi:hypothetical protein